MKHISIIIALILAISLWTTAFTVSYGQTILCYDKTILAVWQLNDSIPCLEDKITALENNPSGSGNATILNDLGDVVISSPSDNQFLRHDGTKWINESVSAGSGNATILDDLGDVDIVNAQTNDVLKYNGTYWVDNTINEDNTVCANVGSGSKIYKDGECNFKTLVGSSDISITNSSNTITIDFNGTSGGDKQIAQVVGQTYLSLAKTNIGNAYIDIYTATFDQEDIMQIDFHNASYVAIYYMWDYVGTGNHQLRWVDVNNNANVLIETGLITSDCDVCSFGYVSIPSWAVDGLFTIEWQGKSTVATDDPIAKGYKIVVK